MKINPLSISVYNEKFIEKTFTGIVYFNTNSIEASIGSIYIVYYTYYIGTYSKSTKIILKIWLSKKSSKYQS